MSESCRVHMTGLREVRKWHGLTMMDSVGTDTCYGIAIREGALGWDGCPE